MSWAESATWSPALGPGERCRPASIEEKTSPAAADDDDDDLEGEYCGDVDSGTIGSAMASRMRCSTPLPSA